ncbi:sensor domain-containing diguanylate cyclase [Clostridium sp. AN503]|uniref:sensor domain-containing diguanylate cyclase n=1 Tax=Clostridium sp. AN503 TaxID=3160598 RepID=UPI00345A75B1
MSDDKKKKRTITAIFLILLPLSALIIFLLARAEKKRTVMQAGYVMISEISKVQYAIDSRLLNAEILEMIVVNNHGTVTDFEMIAERLYDDDPAIRCLQLAPDGIVTYVYPLEGNESAFGSLFDHPDRKEDAGYARDTGRMTLSGPYELSQGGTGLVARNPIYLEDGQNGTAFWGFSVAVLNVPEIFNKAELETLSSRGYFYQIFKIRPENGEIQVITSNTDRDMPDAIKGAITVPNGTWYLNLRPKSGWVSWKNIVMESMIALILNTLFVLLAYGGLTILEQKRKMTELANTDSLTGLYNVRFFMATIKQLYECRQAFGVFYLDLNKFKEVNDQYGHDMGDRLLVEVAARIEGCLKKDDILFRIGGDEFSIIVAGTNPSTYYHALTERIVEQISTPFTVSDIVLYPGISCGYSRYPEDQSDIEKLIQEADRNMYAMKNR